ncbi:MAG: NADH-quinone oxidoreductase subunit NuoG [Deinococcales bacterium]|nr:NADH-quinone oxidoreductase subunit NuoG [Deinococcales bacterium]
MKVRINDVELELAPGTSAIDAVFAAGHDVPYFCSETYMSPIGACRMCLAKVGAPRQDRSTGEWILDEETGEPKVFYFPNLMATCTTTVMEGMVIDTLSEEVKDAQNSMVEFTLINHPLDCPVCDKGGACELQDRAYEYGTGLSRFPFDKRHQEKHHALSELITLDRERCIHCKRCVRYFEEVPGDEVLDFIERGGHTYIGTADEDLPSNFTGNITDICPVGALLDTTSRFRGRNWEYHHTRTTSLDDSSGTPIVVDARTGHIERIKAGLHPDINKRWIDDGIRFGHEYANADDRIQSPMIRKDGELTQVTWDEAMAFIATKINGLAGKEVGLAIRADATLEEGVAVLALAEHLQTGQVDHYPRPNASVIPPETPATFDDLARADAIFVLADVTEELPAADLRIKDALKGVVPPELMEHGVPIADLRLKERMARKRDILTVGAPFITDLMSHSGKSVLYQPGSEADLLEALVAVAAGESLTSDTDHLGFDQSELQLLVTQLIEAQKPVIVCGGLVLANDAAVAAAKTLAKTVDARLMLIGPMANSFGLERIGLFPSHDKYDYEAMISGGAKALILSGLDPAQAPAVATKLEDLDLLVVHDLFLTETATKAHVVLPARTGYGKEGTVMNLEGRLLPVRSAPIENNHAEDFTGLVRHFGEASGVRLEGRSTRSARRVLRKKFDVDLNDLNDQGVLGEAGTESSRQDSSKVNRGQKGNAFLTKAMVRTEYLDKNPSLRASNGGVLLRINPAEANAWGLHDSDVVSVMVGKLRRLVTIQSSELIPEGFMHVPSLPDQPAGLVQVDLGTIQIERSALETV